MAILSPPFFFAPQIVFPSFFYYPFLTQFSRHFLCKFGDNILISQFAKYYQNIPQIIISIFQHSSQPPIISKMIGLFNIPCQSPMEFQNANCRFNFHLDSALMAKFTAESPHQAKYLLDGRKLTENGQPNLPISTTECWDQLIWRSKLFEQSEICNENNNGRMKGPKESGEGQLEEGEEDKGENAQKKSSTIAHLLDQLAAKFSQKRRPSSLFYTNWMEMEEEKTIC